MNQPELGRKIAALRKAKSLTQEELVEKCKINVRTLQRIESGSVSPRSYTLKVILDALEYKDSLENVPAISINNGGNRKKRQEHFQKYAIDLFNLKTNAMKKLSILSASLISITVLLFFIVADVKAQKYTIVIDAGHGGFDPGAQVNDKLIEKDLALSITRLLKEEAKLNADIKFVFTRDNDEYLELSKRVEKANTIKADLFISFHFNSSQNRDNSGIECYTATKSDYREKSEQIGKMLVNEFQQIKDIKVQYNVKQANFKVLRDSKCPALLLSIGYLSNPNDLAFVSEINNQRLICDKIIKAITKLLV